MLERGLPRFQPILIQEIEMEASNPKKYHIKWIADNAGNATDAATYYHPYVMNDINGHLRSECNINTIHADLFSYIERYPKAKGEVKECHCAGR